MAHVPSTTGFHVAHGGSLQGSLVVPGDKSISHRSIMFGSLAHGTTHVTGFLEGEDALGTLQAFRQLGVDIEHEPGGKVVIKGRGTDALTATEAPIDLGNSGTGMRLLTGVFAGLGLPVTLTGDSSLVSRPMRRVVDPLTQMGAVLHTSESGTPPVRIEAGHTLQAIDYTVPMASAQVKSAVLLAGLFANGTTTVREPDITRDHTERMLAGFGVTVEKSGLVSQITGGQNLTATDVHVPGDISSAAFFLVGASIAPGSDLLLKNVGVNPTRTGIIDILRLMGANIELQEERAVGGEPTVNIRVRHAPLRGVEIPEHLVSLAIDEFPAVFVAAAAASGETRVTGAAELRVKETDRIQVMVDGLKILGVDMEGTPDGAVIRGSGRLQGGTVDSCGDHRTAMSFAMASLIAEAPITVLDCANVNTSFPGFADTAMSIGLSVDAIDTEAPNA